MKPAVRRIVTGHDAAGRAVAWRDGICTNQKRPDDKVVSTLVWVTDAAPADFTTDADAGERSIGTAPPERGTRFCVIDYGFAGHPPWTLCAVTLAAGAAAIGAQAGITAMAANLYPTAMRATGLGWALGIGRTGSIVGPALGGIALSYGWSAVGIFVAAAAPAAVAAGVITALGLASPAPAGRQ